MNYDALLTGISDAHRLERMRVFYNHYPQISSVISSSAMRICPRLLPGNELAIPATAVRKSPSILPTARSSRPTPRVETSGDRSERRAVAPTTKPEALQPVAEWHVVKV